VLSGSRGGKYEDESLVGYCAVVVPLKLTRSWPHFSEALAASDSETTRHNIPEDCPLSAPDLPCTVAQH
jgi:hypothetical protein